MGEHPSWRDLEAVTRLQLSGHQSVKLVWAAGRAGSGKAGQGPLRLYISVSSERLSCCLSSYPLEKYPLYPFASGAEEGRDTGDTGTGT